ncbi:C40 family peptidase [Gracilinema caldarium]|uniref:NLP/P60 protein n=1 Tax=Gracilinema caldarium (strain ATCC 51460 / DSM 7334 / H1) TaxID=744872 RepID=F8EZK8_GRAC1|nr:C40 family peptidase [Gracilinema caldarium]AEJ20732.1 NLP/P60 protein [Gracilinema caldarium DSM 7334]
MQRPIQIDLFPLKKALWFFIFISIYNTVIVFPKDTADLRTAIVTTAQKYVGVPYMYGAASPSAFDCSGFVGYVYREAANIKLPRSSRQIWVIGFPIPLAKAQPGDILVFDTSGGFPSHVALLIDKNQMIHAVSQGPKTGVMISSLNDSYFGPRLIGVRRFLSEGVATGTVADAGSKTEKVTTSTTPIASDKAQVKNEIPIDTISFTITNEPVIYTDKIPAQVGSGVQFIVSNGTGKDGTFEILFYKMDMDPAKAKTIRQDRIQIKTGASLELDPIILTETGQYKLILKTSSNLKRVERVWKVVSSK